MSNYTAKSDLKNETGVNTSKFAKMDNLASLKPEINKLDIGRLRTTPVDLNMLNDVVKTEIAEKNEYNDLYRKLVHD